MQKQADFSWVENCFKLSLFITEPETIKITAHICHTTSGECAQQWAHVRSEAWGISFEKLCPKLLPSLRRVKGPWVSRDSDQWFRYIFGEVSNRKATSCFKGDLSYSEGPPWWHRWSRIHLQCKRCRFNPWVQKIPWRMEWLPTPVFLLGEFHGQRSLPDYSLWGHKESDMTEQLTHTSSEISPNDKFHSSACPSWVWYVVKGVSGLLFHYNTIFREHTQQSERVCVSEGQSLAQWPWRTHLN